jgi:hypothetical protein
MMAFCLFCSLLYILLTVSSQHTHNVHNSDPVLGIVTLEKDENELLLIGWNITPEL